MHKKYFIRLLVVLLTLVSVRAMAQSFTNIGTVSGSGSSFALGISRNGTKVTGYQSIAGGSAPFYYVAGDQIYSVTMPSGLPYGYAHSVADSGEFAGYYYDGGTPNRQQSSRWPSRQSTPTDLGGVGGFWDVAMGISNDGSVLAGTAYSVSNGTRAFWWDTTSTSFAVLPSLHQSIETGSANGVTGDGYIAYGFTTKATGGTAPCFWSLGGSTPPTTITSAAGQAFGSNHSGSFFVGQYSNGGTKGFRWERSSNTLLDMGTYTPLDVSDSGNVVVGNFDAGGGQGGHAFIWTSDGGYSDLNTVAGLPSGWVVKDAVGVSGDGSAIACNGTVSTAFRAMLISPFQFCAATPAVTIGTLFDGDATSVAASDDSRYIVLNDDVTYECQVEITGTTSNSTVKQLRFTIESSAGRTGISQQVDFYRFSTSSWVTKIGGIAPVSDVPVEWTETTNANDYRDSSAGGLKCRITWQPINDEDPGQDGWFHSIDMAEWRRL